MADNYFNNAAWLGTIFLVLLPVLLGGCACPHPCGYVEVRSEQVVLEGEQAVEFVPHNRPIHVLKGLSETNPLMVVQVVQREIRYGDVRMDVYGRPVSVPWRWHDPFAKIVVSATGILPLYFSWNDPHLHGADNWTFYDFAYDVFSWYNWFSAMPVGRRVVADREELIKSRFMRAPLAEREVGVPGQPLDLYLEDEKVASQTTDDEGKATFDVGPLITPEIAKEGRQITLIMPRADKEPYKYDWQVSGPILRALLEARETETETELP